MAELPSKIEDYALIGDCLTGALVGRNGSIDWLCWPSFDSEACFAAILGTSDNGRWLIAPRDEVTESSRKYRADTLILETTFRCADGDVTLIDFMPPRGEASDIVRLVCGDRGTVSMTMELVLRFDSGASVPWVQKMDDGGIRAISGPDMAVLRTPVKLTGKDLTTISEFEVKAGDCVPFVLTYDSSHKDVPREINPEHALRDTESFWEEWISHCTYDGKHADIVKRSLMVLKALTYRPTGGIVAALTTSLPEKIGGSRNWDYRYCWLRDATFTLLALMNNGYKNEARDWHHWLLRAVAGAPSNLQIMYSITGQRRLLEWEADWLPGYERSRPVRFGNAAHAQLQLDVYGELMDTFHQARTENIELDETSWGMECALLEHLSTIWDRPDSGIWESRGPGEHYVFSKVSCWVAFDRGIKTAEQYGFKAPVERWRKIRDVIHADVCARGFDRERGHFMMAYGVPYLDASLLLLPAVGFLPPNDKRIVATIEAVAEHLTRDGFILRHDPRQKRDGELEPIEGAFLACTLWLADAYVLLGRIDEARELFLRVANIANDVGLVAEQYDSLAQRQVGNFPQALTHIAIINTANNIHSALHPAQAPNAQRSR
ncbi:glycoside hydrolase family 15 protein [Variibacter gotjawalensis]|uniref:glycoside hydrolase family 15 protein n=1 Tax=Variibacter gotjawalensis TaxID=1333996 RepID=UPI000BBB6219|nr:glycoside hydrolase family 15 protein [Variibacter gotjawalensis]NIK49881.1 GH15 family glucan-1,4-alpha-glucosidase [Variibacter gotjawalensis]